MSRPHPIVSTDWLESHLGDDDLVVLEVSRTRRDDGPFDSGHVPGSRHLYWKDFCWDTSDRQFPDSVEMARRLGELGIGDSTTVVLVGDPIQFATYAFWVLTMAGQATGVHVLDGGRPTWEAEERPMSVAAPVEPAPRHRSVGEEDSSSRVGRDDVLEHLGASDRVLVDFRSDEEFSGERVSPAWIGFDHGAERRGRIPGAVHLYFERLLGSDGTFKAPEDIEAELAAAGVPDDREVVGYCRLSHRASLAWLVLTELVGRDDVRVYDGSWTEWGSMVGMPVELEAG